MVAVVAQTKAAAVILINICCNSYALTVTRLQRLAATIFNCDSDRSLSQSYFVYHSYKKTATNNCSHVLISHY